MMLAMMLALLLHAYCEGELFEPANRASLPGGHRLPRAEREPAAGPCDDLPLSATPRAGAGRAVRRGRRGCAPRPVWRRPALVALDGTKLRANASRERNRTAAQLEAEVERMLAEAEQADAEEQTRSGRQRRDALPPELRSRSQRLARLREAQSRLAAREQARLREREQKDARGRQPKRPESDPDTKVNLSDPDSRVVRDYWGHYQGVQRAGRGDPRAGHRGGRADPRGDRRAGAAADGRDDESQSGGAGSGADRRCCWPTPATTPTPISGRWPRLGPSC